MSEPAIERPDPGRRHDPLTATAQVRVATISDLITALDEPSFVLGEDGRLAFANEAFAREVGVDPDDLRGRSLRDVFDVAPAEAERIVGEIFEGPKRVDVSVGNAAEPPRLEATRITSRRQDRTQIVLVRFRAVGDLVERFRRVTNRLSKAVDPTPTMIIERRMLEVDLAQLEVAARRDALTGLDGRRAFDEALDRACREARREGHPLALLVLDVDEFKRVNDECGHAAGDELLRSFAAMLPESARRPMDVAARVGGEEFAIVLPCCGVVGARRVAEELRARVEAASLPHPSGKVTVSIGVASTDVVTEIEPSALFRAADRALYRAKASGRNRVEVCRRETALPIGE